MWAVVPFYALNITYLAVVCKVNDTYLHPFFIVSYCAIYVVPYLRYNEIMRKKEIWLILVILLMTVVVGCTKTKEKSPVKVAIIDTGISTKATPSEAILEGKNYVNPELDTEDTYGHGTAVASIILENAPEVKLVPLVSNMYENGKIIQVDNDTLAQIIRDAIDVYDCQIINLSAGLASDIESVRQAVEYAKEKQVLIVASAGNDYAESGEVKHYPAAYESVIAVGSLKEDGTTISDFSQRGDWVNIYEIGENVTIKTLSGSTKTGDGTSYSAAKVTAEKAKELEK